MPRMPPGGPILNDSLSSFRAVAPLNCSTDPSTPSIPDASRDSNVNVEGSSAGAILFSECEINREKRSENLLQSINICALKRLAYNGYGHVKVHTAHFGHDPTLGAARGLAVNVTLSQ